MVGRWCRFSGRWWWRGGVRGQGSGDGEQGRESGGGGEWEKGPDALTPAHSQGEREQIPEADASRAPLTAEHQSLTTPAWYLAEDFAFCERARQCGYKIMADTTIRLYHYGSYGYTWEDAGTDAKRFGTYHFQVQPPESPTR